MHHTHLIRPSKSQSTLSANKAAYNYQTVKVPKLSTASVKPSLSFRFVRSGLSASSLYLEILPTQTEVIIFSGRKNVWNSTLCKCFIFIHFSSLILLFSPWNQTMRSWRGQDKTNRWWQNISVRQCTQVRWKIRKFSLEETSQVYGIKGTFRGYWHYL